MNYHFEVAQARYFRDGVLIGTTSAQPLDFTDVAGTSGSHDYRVEITTLLGETATSPTITIDVIANPPLVELTAPVSNARYTTTDASIPLRAVASQPGATISKVEFYRDGRALIGTGSLIAGVYSFDWTGFSAGRYQISARATDSNGIVGV